MGSFAIGNLVQVDAFEFVSYKQFHDDYQFSTKDEAAIELVGILARIIQLGVKKIRAKIKKLRNRLEVR